MTKVNLVKLLHFVFERVENSWKRGKLLLPAFLAPLAIGQRAYVSTLTFSLTHYQKTNFRLFQTERVCIRQFQIWRKWQKVIRMGRNTVGKGEIACHEQFLLSPQCFQKACFPEASKGVIVWEWVKHLLLWNYVLDFDEISQKCSCHCPLQNFLKKFDSFKNSGCHGNKTWNFLKSLKIFLSETIRLRATKFGM